MCNHDGGIVDLGAGPRCKKCLKPQPNIRRTTQSGSRMKVKVRPPSTVRFTEPSSS